MTSHRLERMKEEATCSICLKLMTEPMIIDCGHSYCSMCLVDIVKDEPPASAQRTYFCPQCQTQIQNVSLRPNKQLQSLIEAVKEMDLENLCEEHGDQLRLFCEDDGQLICWRCERSPQHRGHATLLVSEACQGYKKKLQETVEKLKELEVKCNSMEILTSQHITECMQKTVNQKRKVQSDFTKLLNFLHEEEKCHLWRLGKERERVLRSLREGEASLERQSRELQNHILQLEEKGQASAEMLLQDVKDVLSRSSAVTLQLPETVSLSLDNACNVSELYFDVKKIAKSYQGFGVSFSSMNSSASVFKFGTTSSSSGPTKTASNTGSFKYGDEGGFRIPVSSDSGSVNPVNGSFTFSKSTGDFKFGISSASMPKAAKDSQTDNFKFGGFPSLSNAASPFRMSKLGQQVKKKKQPKPSRSFSPGAATTNSAGLSGKGRCSFGTSDTKSVSAAPFTWKIPEAEKEGLPAAKAGFISSKTEPTPLPSAPLSIWGNTGEKQQAPGTSTSQMFGENTGNQEPKCQPVCSFGFLEQVKNESSSKSIFSLSSAKPHEKGMEQPAKATFAFGGATSTTTDQGTAKPVCSFLKSDSSNSGTPTVPGSICFGGAMISSTVPVTASLFGQTSSLSRGFPLGNSAKSSTWQPSLFSQESKPALLGSGSLFGSGSSGISSSFATTCNSSAASGMSIFGAKPSLPAASVSLPAASVTPPGSGLFSCSRAPAAFTMGSNEKNLFFS